ncbi:MAG: N-acetylmuramoyl-L-alanine amidase [Candidatus Omnitrophica bacterium]|nr:N-acetylmuramoyl-L-alanine amidase [Candidatus Omnitrophota bacterium]
MRILRISFLSLLVFLSAGCATSPVRDTGSFKNQASANSQCVYTDITSIINTYNTAWEWDGVKKILILRKGDNDVEMALGSRLVLVDGVLHKLQSPVIMRRSNILVPNDFCKSILADLFIHGRISKDSPSPRARHTIKRIVLDPGHGGKDPGAVGQNGLREKDIVLDIAKGIKRYLEAGGLDIRLTRDKDIFISLWKRADIANKYEADFFISIHANAARSGQANGFEVFYLSEAVDDNARAVAAVENASLKYEDSSFGNLAPSSELEAILWDIEYSENRQESIELAKSITQITCGNLNLKNRGQKAANFYVLKGAKMPSVLVEVGFISNAREAQRLGDASYRGRIARLISEGIINYRDEYEAAEGFTTKR